MLNHTTTGGTVEYAVVWYSTRDDTTTTTDYTPSVQVPVVVRLGYDARETPVQVRTAKMMRDLDAARAHHDFVTAAVRLPPPPPPPARKARHGYYPGPRGSAHTATRCR